MSVVNNGLLNKLMRCCQVPGILSDYSNLTRSYSLFRGFTVELIILCTLECAPLSCWDPNDSSELLLAQEISEVELGVVEIENSKWVSQLLKSFCKLVGFLIVKHED